MNLRGGSGEPVRVKQEPQGSDYRPSCQMAPQAPSRSQPPPLQLAPSRPLSQPPMSHPAPSVSYTWNFCGRVKLVFFSV